MVGTILILVAIVIFTGVAWYLLAQPAAKPIREEALNLPAGISIRAQPLLTKKEAELYNMLCLAVQEQYLVFAKVPLRSWVQVRAQDSQYRPAASSFFSKMPKKHLDFVLVHPGTLSVATAIELENGAPVLTHIQEREKLVQKMCQAAGVKLIKLNSGQHYTAPSLASLLGIEHGD